MADLAIAETARLVADYIENLAVGQLGDIGFSQMIYKQAGLMIYRAPRAKPEGVEPNSPGAPKTWRARVMLTGPDGSVEADSMPDADPDTQPDAVLVGLLAIGQWARSCAEGHHVTPPVGLDDAALEHSILSLRVALSRKGGRTWWHLPYAVDGEQWMALIRVERAT